MLDLHSFPTRRSSDLGLIIRWSQVQILAGPPKQDSAVASMKACLLVSPAPVETQPLQYTEVPVREPDSHEVLVRIRDRKSTRLNSSHTVISYAVFCLK